jgi:hypothetical protein
LRRATGLIAETKAEWETDLERNGFEVSDGFFAASASLMDEWGRNLGTETSTEKIIRDSLLKVVQQRVKKLHNSLEALALQLRDDLKKSAAELAIADVPGEDEFPSLVRGTPIFDPGYLITSVVRPRLSVIFGRRFAEKLLAKRLQQQLDETLNKMLGTYSDVLKEWTRLVTDQLLRRFEAYAEGYRAQAERSLRGKELTKEEAHTLQEDLKLLEVRESSGVDADVQKQLESKGVPPLLGETILHARKGESH